MRNACRMDDVEAFSVGLTIIDGVVISNKLRKISSHMTVSRTVS